MTTVTERALIAVAALLLSACAPEPTLPVGAMRFDPPERFRTLWAETEACSGKQRPFSAVSWYQVPGMWEVTMYDGRQVAAFYDLRRDIVVIAGAYMTSDPLIRHESLHAILDRPGHPVEFDLCNLRLNESQLAS
jgi:hypothetical protein